MPRFLAQSSYTPEGTKGLVREGGTQRREAVQQAIETMGGTLEAFFFGYGDTDVYAICDFPDITSALSVKLALNSSLAGHVTLVALATPEEVDAAAKRPLMYRMPGE